MTVNPVEAEILMASVDRPECFQLVVETWGEALVGYFFRRTFDAEVSMDLTAETFAVAFERRASYVNTGAPASAWLFGIASRELSRYRRRRRVSMRAVQRLGIQPPTLDQDSIDRIEELVDAEAHRAALSAAVGHLTAKERDAIRLRVIDQHPYDEVSRQLGCSEGAARVRVHRGLQRLAHLLEVTT